MNAVREINRINQRELELGLAGKGSWHDEYKDSAYVFVGGLSYDLTEGDVITVFSQWGEIVDINMPRDKETGKQKGFGFIMYEDQRSTILAVDNMNGTQVLGRTIRVDHCRKYNQPGKKNAEGEHVAPEEPTYNAMPPILDGSDDSESSDSEQGDELDEEDPMAAFIRAEKRKEKIKNKTITDGKSKKRKHEGETKEERRARKEAKRAKKAAKEAKKLGGGSKSSLKVKEEKDGRDRSERYRNGEKDRSRERYDRNDREGRDRDDWSRRDRSEEKGRANRDDWQAGRWELEREERDSGRRWKEDENRDDRKRGDRNEVDERRDKDERRYRDDYDDRRSQDRR